MKKQHTTLSFAAAENEYPCRLLKFVADALNIEGGMIAQKYLRPDQIWANICVVLDRPFEDGLEWIDITRNNRYPLKESSLPHYNEPSVSLAYAVIMHYYITEARKLKPKSMTEEVTILIQVHRDTSGARPSELLERLLCECYPELKKVRESGDAFFKQELFSYYFPELNVRVYFSYGTLPHQFAEARKYENADIILSYSLVAGLKAEWQSGSLLVPSTWMPVSLGILEIDESTRYSVHNHLHDALDAILLSQNGTLLDVINRKFRSPNPLKSKQRARMLLKSDFKEAHLLQVDGMFNPSELAPSFKIVSSIL